MSIDVGGHHRAAPHVDFVRRAGAQLHAAEVGEHAAGPVGEGPGYVFGTDLQHPDWQHVLVMEGVFDALSISGLAVLHAEISDSQARLIRSLGREITVVPDQDSAGMKLVDRALELGWAVSMPEWPEGCKDVNDAVKLFGKFGALVTIMQARETSRVKIELRRRQIAKRVS